MEGDRPKTPDERSHVERMVMHEYARKLKLKRVSHWAVLGSIGATVILLTFGAVTGLFVFENPIVYLVIMSAGIMSLLGVGVFQLINWRCPQCQGQFHAQRNPRFCSTCGVRLRE